VWVVPQAEKGEESIIDDSTVRQYTYARRFLMSENIVPIIESQETITRLLQRYNEALVTYQGAKSEQQGPQQDQEAQQRTYAGYAEVLTQARAVLRGVLSYPTITDDPDREREKLLRNAHERLLVTLEDYTVSARLSSTDPFYQGRVVMLETFFTNLDEIQLYR
jgi:hypothetical protein